MRRRSIGWKLVGLVVTSLAAAVACIALVSAWSDAQRYAGSEAARLTGTAKVIASLAAESVAANDRPRAFRAIRAVSQMPEVQYARITRAGGRLLTETGAGVRLTKDTAVKDGEGMSVLDLLSTRSIRASAPVIFEGRTVGTVVLLGRLDGVGQRIWATILVSALGAAAAGVAGLLVAWRMGRRISGPIGQLSGAMRRVQETHDYGVSVEIATDDEVGELAEGFNRMLADIRARDAKIAAHVEELEAEVAARTADYRAAKDTAEAASRAKSDFLATMSHEIRTPMNGILAMADLLFATELPKRQKRYAEVIAKSGRSLLSIINDILDFSKIEAGKLELEAESICLAEAADDVASLFQERARSKGLDLAAFADPSLPRVRGDAVRLRQIIGNLVNNAVKFTESGGVTIEITSDPQAEGHILVAVRDTGIGIPEDKLPGLFEAFTQADQSTTRRFGGTGLGLTICKRLVSAMGGTWRISSKEGEGSVFAFSWPAEVGGAAEAWPATDVSFACAGLETVTTGALRRYLAAAGARERAVDVDLVFASAVAAVPTGPRLIRLADPGETPGAAELVLSRPLRQADVRAVLQALAEGRALSELEDITAGPATLPRFEGAVVLVADDSEVNREVAAEALARLGVKAEFAVDGREALEMTGDRTYDLVLMDGSMPELDGFEATRAVREREVSTGLRQPVVALTAHVVGEAAEAWRDAGMAGVLHKPFTLAALAATLGRFLTSTGVTAQAMPEPCAVSEPVEVDDALFDPAVRAELAAMAAAGGGDFVAKVEGIYRSRAPEQVLAVRGAGDPESQARAAHALKSMSLNLGAQRVAALSARIERDAREGGRMAGPDLIEELETVVIATIAGFAVAPEPEAETVEPVMAQPAAPAPVEIIAEAPRVVVPEPVVDPELEAALGALDRSEIEIVYQAQFDRAGAGVRGVEALARWRRGEALVGPEELVGLLERAGATSRLTERVLEIALHEVAPHGQLILAVNVSAAEVTEPGFVERIAAALARARFPARRLEIEVTETAVFADEAAAVTAMNALRKLGVRLALDDFGAGFTSLRYLQVLPLDTLKIDKGFIAECLQGPQSAAIIHAVVSIGRSLGLTVVAEGVETGAQANFLRIAGAHVLQGWHFGEAGPLEAVLQAELRPRGAQAQAS